MKVIAVHVYPPIPDRNSDWMVYDEDTYDGAEDSHPVVGWGPTRAAARADFTQLWIEHAVDRASNRVAEILAEVRWRLYFWFDARALCQLADLVKP